MKSFIYLFLIFCLNIDVLRGLKKKKQQNEDCLSLTNASLFVFLILIDFLHYDEDYFRSGYIPESTESSQDEIKAKIKHIWDQSEAQCSYSHSEESKKIEQEVTKKKYYTDFIKFYKQYRVSINVDTDIGHIEYISKLDKPPNNLKMKQLWNKILDKRASLHIDYKINMVSFKAIFNENEIKDLLFSDVDEILTVLEWARRIIDTQLTELCDVDHQDSFVKKYEPLKSELGDEFMEYLHKLDSIKGFDKVWYLFAELVTKMEEIDKGAYPPTDEIKKTGEEFQFPISILAINYDDLTTNFSLEKNEESKIRSSKQRKIRCHSYFGDYGGAVGVKLTYS